MTQAAAIERIGRIGLIALDNPPVNAAGHALRAGLMTAIETLEADPEIDAIGLYGRGKCFIAGADIREFGKPPADPWLPEVCNRIEACTKPVIAVLHGPTLGGGLEVALSAHARIACGDVSLGFPEVTLGIIPGAGGTQRAPRLCGIAPALDLITTGKRIDADAALGMGLVDEIRADAPHALALAAAEEAAEGRLATRRTSDLHAAPDPDAAKAITERLLQRVPHLFAPHRAVEAVVASNLTLAEGLARERQLYQLCMDSPQRAGLIHAFFTERTVAKIPEAAAPPRAIQEIGIIGAGTMGAGIATACLLAGATVTLVEREQAPLTRGVNQIAKNLDGAVARGKLSASARDALCLTPTTDMADLVGVDLVIEAVFEDLDVKKQIFAAIDRLCPDAILASNTSYLDLNAIAQATGRPGDVIGLHFFSPAHVMRLIEVVVGAETKPEITASAFALATRLKKVAVRAGVCDGFIGNRIMTAYRKAADYLVLDGARPEEVDAAIRDFGFAMGPFEVSDLAGLDIGWAARKRLAPTRPPEERYSAIADRICEAGWLGRKAGRGWYLYDEGAVRPNPEVAPLVEAERRAHGIAPRSFAPDEIVARYLTAMIAEGARVLEEGIALRPIDIDAVFLFGYGFPRWRGGPMHYADTLGAATIAGHLGRLAGEDPYFWATPQMIATMAESGGTFADLNKEARDESRL